METLHVARPPAASPCGPCAPLEQPSPSPQLIAPATEKEKICVMLPQTKESGRTFVHGQEDERGQADERGQVGTSGHVDKRAELS